MAERLMRVLRGVVLHIKNDRAQNGALWNSKSERFRREILGGMETANVRNDK